MSEAGYSEARVSVHESVLEVSVTIRNRLRGTWSGENFSLGWQFFDPQSNRFIEEGAWTPVLRAVPPGETANFKISIPFPPEPGAYEIYVSHIQPSGGWAYTRGERFLRILLEAGAEVSDGQLRIVAQEITTVRSLRWRRMW